MKKILMTLPALALLLSTSLRAETSKAGPSWFGSDPSVNKFQMGLHLGMGGYRDDRAVTYGLSAETPLVGLKAMMGPYTLFRSDRDQVANGTRTVQSEIWLKSLNLYGRVPLNARFELQPGLQWSNSYFRYTSDSAGSTRDILRSGNETEKRADFVVPEASLVFKPLSRLRATAGVGYALFVPSHYLDFDDGMPEWSKRLGFHGELSFMVF
jgi:hypothetical protein